MTLDMALWSREKAQNPKILQDGGRGVELAHSAPAYQITVLRKRKGLLSASDTALWDQEKAHSPKTSPPGRTERNIYRKVLKGP